MMRLWYNVPMELFITIIVLAILAETTVLTIKASQKHFINPNQKRKVYVDTSALMDQRLVPLAQTGFIGDDIIVPRSVVHELQLLADGKDHDKRIRAREGLDAVRELERVVHFNFELLDDPLDRTPVDNRLLELAKANHGLILTNDYNLQKVAATEHVETLNLNNLAMVMRSNHFLGEQLKLRIASAGSIVDQGVGYLKDGTMVVVEHASKYIGEEIEVELVHLNQTSVGQMFFAKVAGATSTPAASVSTTKSVKPAQSAKPAKTMKPTQSKAKMAKPKHPSVKHPDQRRSRA